MNTEITFQEIATRSKLFNAFGTALAVAGLVMLSAWVKVPLPFTPVPVTMQTLAVLLAAAVLPPGEASLGMGIYLLCGMAGAPVFAVPFGPTFGYIVAFVMVPWVVSSLENRAVGMLLSLGLIYGCGLSWLMFWTHLSFLDATLLGVLPFVPGDIIKAVIAHRLACRFSRG
ncbi:MAG TPA: biotin transporter BioY [Candidatus Hydrogenedentes bacterium]|nr:biotin transporter BioY [Candidatus Hydrogenedentota bacterium]HOL76514.1 biotin transporter BioY [Candidatus Hydrogenedentota bacterium]HPO85179.1 biotin transporter BioY [Candidatus Hydrogenedentota bacterium]